MVQRFFVEKRPGFNVEAAHALEDFKENLALSALSSVRIVLRYDVEGLEQEELAVANVFSEPAVDTVYREELPLCPEDSVFAVEYLPGQYDQRADSAAQCVQLLTRGARPEVRTAKLYILRGADDDAISAIKRYVINPVDSREASLSKPDSLAMSVVPPEKVEVIAGFASMSNAEAEELRTSGGFAMSADDMLFVREQYKNTEHRDPTITELRVIDTYWSDHCRHTTFSTKLEDVEFEEGPVAARVSELFAEYLKAKKELGRAEKPVCLMDIATSYVREAKSAGMLPKLDESEEINACSFKETIETTDGPRDVLIMFKNETHNHPTEIEPFGGAATCLGGAIRDPLSGRSYVYQAMRITGSGDPRERVEDTLPHKLPQKKLARQAAQGYSSYGNQIGLATGLVHEIYHEGYKAKHMEIGAVVGAAPAENVIRERPIPGDVILLIGGRTGRDGCGGATGSSKAHNEKSIEECGAEVQKGNPLTERKLQRLFRDKRFSSLVKRCNDFGAGGVCVAIGELADGLDIDLNTVPKKYEGLTGTELAISESQERMAVVVAKEDADRVLELCESENLEATLVARVTDGGRMRMTWNGDVIVDISRAFLDTNGAPQQTSVLVTNPEIRGALDEDYSEDLAETVKKLLGDPNNASQRGLIERFDSTIGANTVTLPLGGKTQLTPVQAMSAKIPVGETNASTTMSWAYDPDLTSVSPMNGAACAVVSSVAKLAASGGDVRKAWLTLQEYFERMGSPESWGKPFAALLGAWSAQRGLGVAAIGGKDSMSGSFNDIHVPPTVCSFAICPGDAREVVTPELKAAGHKLYLLEIERDELFIPVYSRAKKKYIELYDHACAGHICSAYAIERGGMLIAAIKMALGNGIGVRFADELSAKRLTRRFYGNILIESDVELPYTLVGETTNTGMIEALGQSMTLAECEKIFTGVLERIYPTKFDALTMPETHICTEKPSYKPAVHIAKPRVVIPVFPGTNCEYDLTRAFEKAGAKAETVIIRNLRASAINESIEALASAIESSQIVMIPGGFSGGDEPDGSGKFIATVFRNERIAEAVMKLLKQRDGLMLGICNGFQALIKLGLVPYGEIRPMRSDSPTLTFNTMGRHISRMVSTRVTSAKSPWLANVEPGSVYSVAISHGEGRFVATPEETAQLFANGQVATQYVDFSGQPSMDSAHNPNGSVCAVEGLLSPDGRVFGKMAHNERYAENNFRNIPGEMDMGIFAAGVAYYK